MTALLELFEEKAVMAATMLDETLRGLNAEQYIILGLVLILALLVIQLKTGHSKSTEVRTPKVAYVAPAATQVAPAATQQRPYISDEGQRSAREQRLQNKVRRLQDCIEQLHEDHAVERVQFAQQHEDDTLAIQAAANNKIRQRHADHLEEIAELRKRTRKAEQDLRDFRLDDFKAQQARELAEQREHAHRAKREGRSQRFNELLIQKVETMQRKIDKTDQAPMVDSSVNSMNTRDRAGKDAARIVELERELEESRTTIQDLRASSPAPSSAEDEMAKEDRLKLRCIEHQLTLLQDHLGARIAPYQGAERSAESKDDDNQDGSARMDIKAESASLQEEHRILTQILGEQYTSAVTGTQDRVRILARHIHHFAVEIANAVSPLGQDGEGGDDASSERMELQELNEILQNTQERVTGLELENEELGKRLGTCHCQHGCGDENVRNTSDATVAESQTHGTRATEESNDTPKSQGQTDDTPTHQVQANGPTRETVQTSSTSTQHEDRADGGLPQEAQSALSVGEVDAQAAQPDALGAHFVGSPITVPPAAYLEKDAEAKKSELASSPIQHDPTYEKNDTAANRVVICDPLQSEAIRSGLPMTTNPEAEAPRATSSPPGETLSEDTGAFISAASPSEPSFTTGSKDESLTADPISMVTGEVQSTSPSKSGSVLGQSVTRQGDPLIPAPPAVTPSGTCENTDLELSEAPSSTNLDDPWTQTSSTDHSIFAQPNAPTSVFDTDMFDEAQQDGRARDAGEQAAHTSKEANDQGDIAHTNAGNDGTSQVMKEQDEDVDMVVESPVPFTHFVQPQPQPQPLPQHSLTAAHSVELSMTDEGPEAAQNQANDTTAAQALPPAQPENEVEMTDDEMNLIFDSMSNDSDVSDLPVDSDNQGPLANTSMEVEMDDDETQHISGSLLDDPSVSGLTFDSGPQQPQADTSIEVPMFGSEFPPPISYTRGQGTSDSMALDLNNAGDGVDDDDDQSWEDVYDEPLGEPTDEQGVESQQGQEGSPSFSPSSGTSAAASTVAAPSAPSRPKPWVPVPTKTDQAGCQVCFVFPTEFHHPGCAVDPGQVQPASNDEEQSPGSVQQAEAQENANEGPGSVVDSWQCDQCGQPDDKHAPECPYSVESAVKDAGLCDHCFEPKDGPHPDGCPNTYEQNVPVSATSPAHILPGDEPSPKRASSGPPAWLPGLGPSYNTGGSSGYVAVGSSTPGVSYKPLMPSGRPVDEKCKDCPGNMQVHFPGCGLAKHLGKQKAAVGAKAKDEEKNESDQEESEEEEEEEEVTFVLGNPDEMAAGEPVKPPRPIKKAFLRKPRRALEG